MAVSTGRSQWLACSHARRPSHDFAAFDRADDGLGEMVEAGILGKKSIQHGAQQEHAGALEGLLVDRNGNLDAARGADAAALADAAHDRPAVDAAHAANPALGNAVR